MVSAYRPSIVSGQGESHHVLILVEFPEEKVWFLCGHFILQESHLWAEDQRSITSLPAIVLSPQSKNHIYGNILI